MLAIVMSRMATPLQSWKASAKVFICALVVALVSTQAVANQFLHSLTQISDQVNQTLSNHYHDIGRFAEVNINTQSPDQRLQLPHCQQPIEIKQPTGYDGGRITTQVTCRGTSNRWSVYVVSQVQLLAEVLVAEAPLRRGQVVSPDDLAMALIDVSRVGTGYLNRFEDAIGQELSRSVNTGDALRAQWLLAPRAIKRGDRVTILAKANQVAVEATGTALADGRLGEQVRVRNDRSERVVRGLVTDYGLVVISL